MYKLLKPDNPNGHRAAVGGGHGSDTPGKRTPYIASLGRHINEHEFNEPVANLLAEELLRHGFEVLLIAPGDADVPLQTRTDLANEFKCDIYVSIHFNAYDGSFEGADPSGISVHIYDGNVSDDTHRLAECVANHLKQGTQQTFRGIKRNNFHVLRETYMSAILTENGFMDNEREALLMLDKDFQQEVATEHAKGVCDFFNIDYVEDSGLYKVQVGAFSNKENAQRLADDLQSKGYPTYIVKEEQ